MPTQSYPAGCSTFGISLVHTLRYTYRIYVCNLFRYDLFYIVLNRVDTYLFEQNDIIPHLEITASSWLYLIRQGEHFFNSSSLTHSLCHYVCFSLLTVKFWFCLCLLEWCVCKCHFYIYCGYISSIHVSYNKQYHSNR